MSDAVSPARVFTAILLRDVTVARRERPYFLVRTTLQPLLFVTVFGFLLPRMGLIPHGYATMMLPGIIALSLTLSAILLVTILSGAAFSAMGLYLGTAIAPQQIGLMFSVILAPMIMFGCTYYPWIGLQHIPAMQYLVLVDPLVYVSEGMRAALTPAIPHMPVAAMLAALVLISVLFLWLGLRAFDRRAIS